MPTRFGGVLRKDYKQSVNGVEIHWKAGEFVEVQSCWQVPAGRRIKMAQGRTSIEVVFASWPEFTQLFSEMGYRERRETDRRTTEHSR